MPERPPVFVPPGTRSPEQRRKEYAKRRKKTVEAGYDWRWRRLRALYLDLNPLCQCPEHQGDNPRALAEVVDHIVPIADNPDLRLDWDNLRAMTKRCHDKHTAATRGWGRHKGATKS